MIRPAALALALPLALAAACTSASPPAPVLSPEPPAPAGTVRAGYPAEPPTLDPVAPSGASWATRDVLRPTLPALFRLDERLRPQPELAAAWPSEREITRDPFSVTLRLRPARWSDGKQITSSDVRFSLERLRAGPTGNRYRFLREVEVLSPRRFKLVFDRPVRRWWALFSVDDMVLPAHAFGEGWDRRPAVSGGPFLVEGWTPGLSIRLRRNEMYWGEKAPVAAIEVLFVPDDETRLQLLARGDLDLVFAEGESNIGARAKARGAAIVAGALDARRSASGAWGPAWWELELNLARVGDRPALVEAMGRALDRRLVTELFDDSGQVMDGVPARFPVAGAESFGQPGIPGPFPAADLGAAREILRKAGFRKSGDTLRDPRRRKVEIILAFAEAPTPAAIARLVHFRLRELGVHVEIVPVEALPLERDWIVNGRADAFLVLRRGADAPDAASYRSDAPAARNLARVRSADEAIDQAETGGTGRARTGLDPDAWARAQGLLVQSHAVLPLVRVRSWLVSRGGITGPHPTGAAHGPFWNAGAWRLADVA